MTEDDKLYVDVFDQKLTFAEALEANEIISDLVMMATDHNTGIVHLGGCSLERAKVDAFRSIVFAYFGMFEKREE